MLNRIKFLLNLVLLGFTLGCVYCALQRRWDRVRGKQAPGDVDVSHGATPSSPA